MSEKIRPGPEQQPGQAALPLPKVPREGVVVGVIGGVFMSSVPQTPEYQAIQKEAAAKIRLRR